MIDLDDKGFRRVARMMQLQFVMMSMMLQKRETMKSRNSILRHVVLAVGMTAVAALAGTQLACGAPIQDMRAGSNVPASEGTVLATEGDNGNTNVAVRVKHLAPPAKVATDATVYVVWIQPRNAAKQSIGSLILDDNLEGRLDTVTSFRRFALMVTPEPSGQVPQPTHEPVFTSDVDRPE